MSSLMMKHPRMTQLLNDIKHYQIHIYMGALWGESPKPSYLWTSSPWVTRLALQHFDRAHMTNNISVTRRYTNEQGQTKISGGPDLKATQAYPRAFGQKLAELFETHGPTHRADPTPHTSQHPYVQSRCIHKSNATQAQPKAGTPPPRTPS